MLPSAMNCCKMGLRVAARRSGTSYRKALCRLPRLMPPNTQWPSCHCPCAYLWWKYFVSSTSMIMGSIVTRSRPPKCGGFRFTQMADFMHEVAPVDCHMANSHLGLLRSINHWCILRPVIHEVQDFSIFKWLFEKKLSCRTDFTKLQPLDFHRNP